MGRKPMRSARSIWRRRIERGATGTSSAGRLVDEIAEHERRLLQPGNHSQRRPIRAIQVVPIPGLPVHERVPAGRVHLHVGAEQIGAEVGPMIEAVLDEELAGNALANETPLHVTDRGDDRIDLARGDERGEIRHADLAPCSPGHAQPFPRGRHGLLAVPIVSVPISSLRESTRLYRRSPKSCQPCAVNVRCSEVSTREKCIQAGAGTCLGEESEPRSTRDARRPARLCWPPASLSIAMMNVLGDDRHELIADKARLTGTGFGNRHPAIDRGARDFQLRRPGRG